MKKSIYILAGLMAFTLSFTACENKENKNDDATVAAEDTVAVLSVDSLLSNAEALVGQTVTFEGVCTHTCAHGGKKMFVMGSDDTKNIRVDANDEIGSFPAEVANSMVEVVGTLIEERIDEAAILKMEEEHKAGTAEKHGEENAEGCSTEKAAQGQKDIDTFAEQMKDYRTRIADRKAKEGKEYLSFYAIQAQSYKVK